MVFRFLVLVSAVFVLSFPKIYGSASSPSPLAFEWESVVNSNQVKLSMRQISFDSQDDLARLKALCDANENPAGVGSHFSFLNYEAIEGELRILHNNKSYKLVLNDAFFRSRLGSKFDTVFKEAQKKGLSSNPYRKKILLAMQKGIESASKKGNWRDFYFKRSDYDVFLKADSASDGATLEYADFVGYYGFYKDTDLVGLIKMTKEWEGRMECEMAMHPGYPNQGFGSIFRREFQERIINPRLHSCMSLMIADSGASPGFVMFPFLGTCGYVHVDNIASRKLLAKLHHTPVDLHYKEYLRTDEKAAQIFYVSNISSAAIFISEEIKTLILRNKKADKEVIVSAAVKLQECRDRLDVLSSR